MNNTCENAAVLRSNQTDGRTDGRTDTQTDLLSL